MMRVTRNTVSSASGVYAVFLLVTAVQISSQPLPDGGSVDPPSLSNIELLLSAKTIRIHLTDGVATDWTNGQWVTTSKEWWGRDEVIIDSIDLKSRTARIIDGGVAPDVR